MMSKVPIPAMPRERPQPRQRTTRACDVCRARKVKCNGELPTCSNCRSQGFEKCSYSDKKNVRQRKELGSAKQTIQQYEELLRDLSLVVDGEYVARIADALEGNSSDRDGSDVESRDQTNPVATLRSLDAMPTVDEDLNRNQQTRATGYHGKTSEVTWIKHLSSDMRKEADKLQNVDLEQIPDLSHGSTADASYHLDGQGGPVTIQGNPQILPPRRTVEDLISAYFRHVNLTLPIIREDLFKRQCNQLYSDGSSAPGKKWIAVFNLILAIGAKFYNMAHVESGTDDAIFFARAQTANMADLILNDDDLQQVQVQTLMAFYFLVTSQINRAWKVIGMAARSGISLGLNLHSTHRFSEGESFNARVNLWWSIFRLDTLLSLMTGRPSGLGENLSIAPLPLEFCTGVVSPGQPWQEHTNKQSIQWTIYQNQRDMINQQNILQSLPPSSSLFRFYLIDLTLITHVIANRVFSEDVFQDGWSDIERRIAYYNVRLGQWRSGLHPSVQFADHQGKTLPGPLSAFQTALAFHYYSARIVLNRPCFGRFGMAGNPEVQFPRSHFGSQTAANGLDASLALISLLPDTPDMEWCFLVGPWWSLLHFIVQALTILLIHLSIGQGHYTQRDSPSEPNIAGAILIASKKAIRWLFSLGPVNEAASRAFDRCYACLQIVAVTKGLDWESITHDWTFSRSVQSSHDMQSDIVDDPLKEGSHASTDQGLYSFYSPFTSFGSEFYLQGPISNPAHTSFEDLLTSLMDKSSESNM